MSYREHKQQSPQSVSCAVLIISDSRTEKDDESGKLLKQKLSQSGHQVVDYSILKNDSDAVRVKIAELLGHEEVQVIITSGGTGVGQRDITVETMSSILEKKLDGFGELFRSLSYKELTDQLTKDEKIDEIILPEIGHMVREATR